MKALAIGVDHWITSIAKVQQIQPVEWAGTGYHIRCSSVQNIKIDQVLEPSKVSSTERPDKVWQVSNEMRVAARDR